MSDITVESEIAGTVWKIEASPGDSLEEEGIIMILESMKMEIPVLAPEDGTLSEVLVSEGDTIREGQPLAKLSRGG
ncbi:biotin/lipoyl-binding carrier protein [Aquicoccus sp. SCR17]|nr:biotin/lipoyl-binding carrier protein [Carideicomes alvinocaridis]